MHCPRSVRRFGPSPHRGQASHSWLVVAICLGWVSACTEASTLASDNAGEEEQAMGAGMLREAPAPNPAEAPRPMATAPSPSEAASIAPAAPLPPSALPAAAAGGCAAPTGEGTTHSDAIVVDTVWTAADSPHLVPYDLSVSAGVLRIEPCAVVRLRPGVSLRVGSAGGRAAALFAKGDVVDVNGEQLRRPVRFERAEGGAWGGLSLLSSGLLDLEVVDLRGGGSTGAALLAQGGVGPQGLDRIVRTVDVTIDGSDRYGASLTYGAAFSEDSRDLVIRGAGALPPTSAVDTTKPLYVEGLALSTIPTGSYTGNGSDEIAVGSSGGLPGDVTLHQRGVPYRVLDTLSLRPANTAAAGGLITLTIEAGVTLLFDKAGSGVHLGSSNGELPENLWPVRLIAAGTPSAPIVLTSGNPIRRSAGDWVGIEWAAGPPTGNVMSNVRIEYAGADSGTGGFGCGPGDNDAALLITNWQPAEAFISDCTISDSLGGGIVSGWHGDGGPRLGDGNVFRNIGNGCNTAYWHNDDGSCPTPIEPSCY